MAEEIARPPCRLAVATRGSTTRSTAAAPLIKIVPRRTALAEQPAEILFPIDRPVPDNKLAGRAATWPAPAAEPVSAIGPGEAVSETEAAPASATGLAGVEQIASEAAISRAAAAETATLSEAVPEDTADPALAAAAAEAPPVLALVAEAEALVAEAVVADDAGRLPTASRKH